MLYSADVVMAVLVVLLVARGLWDLFRSDDSPLTLKRIGRYLIPGVYRTRGAPGRRHPEPRQPC